MNQPRTRKALLVFINSQLRRNDSYYRTRRQNNIKY